MYCYYCIICANQTQHYPFKLSVQIVTFQNILFEAIILYSEHESLECKDYKENTKQLDVITKGEFF